MSVNKYYFTGFMGAGKSTTGRVFAKYLGLRFVDLDEEAERAEGCPITEMFAKGEGHFRDIEHRELKKFEGVSDVVIATGGGTFVQPRNRELMMADGIVIFIDTPLTYIRNRLIGDTTRPLFQGDPEAVAARFSERRASYLQAHIRVDGSSTPRMVADEILDRVASFRIATL